MIFLDAERGCYVSEGRDYPRFSKIMEAVGAVDKRWFSEFHAIRGTHVHTATELIDRDNLDEDSLDEQLIPYTDGYRKFLHDVRPEILYIELPLIHRALGYGTTLDRVLMIKGRLGVMDIKSCKQLPAWVGQQTQAHKMVWNFSQFNCDRIQERYALQLPGDGSYRLHVLEDGNDLTKWMNNLNAYQKLQGAEDDS